MNEGKPNRILMEAIKRDIIMVNLIGLVALYQAEWKEKLTFVGPKIWDRGICCSFVGFILSGSMPSLMLLSSFLMGYYDQTTQAK